ncbi:MAG: hypothetical protein ACRBFS_19355 [Aureispira sp.]
MADLKDLVVGSLALVGVMAVAERGAYAVGEEIGNNIDYQVNKPIVNLNRSLEGIVLVTLPVGITNDNSFSIQIDKFQGKIFYGQTYLSDILINQPLSLGANKYTKVKLLFEADINEAMTSVAGNYINTGTTSLLNSLYLKGVLQILSTSFSGSLSIPIELPIPII